ncbi:MAG: AAA family ATPase, partial [Elusimicrobiota bacterium]
MSHNIHVRFVAGLSPDVIRNLMARYTGATALGAGDRVVYRVPASSEIEGIEHARALMDNESVDMVSVPPTIFLRMTGDSDDEAAPQSEEDASQMSFPGMDAPIDGHPGDAAFGSQAGEHAAPEVVSAPIGETAAPVTASAAAESVSPAESSELSIPNQAVEKDSREWAPKIAAGGALAEKEFRVTLVPGLSKELRKEIQSNIHQDGNVATASFDDDGILVVVARYSMKQVADMARNIAERKAVESLVISNAARDELFSTPLPAKIALHGKEHWSTGVVLVKFTGETAESQIKAILGKSGQKTLFRQGDAYVLNAGSASKAAISAVSLVANEEVAGVEVHANVAAALENRSAVPYPAAESYDPAQAVLVQFKADATPEQMKAYAEPRGLRLVYPEFRGGQKLALMEIAAGADAAVTRQMLLDETLDEGSLATGVTPFKEQTGDAPLVPSAQAKARAEARKAAAAAAEEVKNRKPRRDVQGEWISYLQSHKLQDGTTLSDKQVQVLAEFLKPVAKGPGESRAPVVARTEEVKRMLPIVTSPRGMRNSVVLVGGAGTGKTAVAEGLAEMIEDAENASANDADQFLQFQRLKGRWLVELDINKVLSAEEPIKVLNLVLDLLPRFNDANPGRGNEIIVLMDEIQKFFLDNNGQKIANVLKGPLRDGKISVIATTTDKEYRDFIEKDDAFRRRLEKIDVAEPTVPQTTRILRAMKGWLQKIHDAFVPDEVLVAAAKLTDQFDKTNFNPDKSIKAVQDGAELSRPENLRAAVTL